MTVWIFCTVDKTPFNNKIIELVDEFGAKGEKTHLGVGLPSEPAPSILKI